MHAKEVVKRGYYLEECTAFKDGALKGSGEANVATYLEGCSAFRMMRAKEAVKQMWPPTLKDAPFSRMMRSKSLDACPAISCMRALLLDLDLQVKGDGDWSQDHVIGHLSGGDKVSLYIFVHSLIS